jgi:ribulose-5-phosphate 4-epimerase/fuculose-1-phosphate aldolase
MPSDDARAALLKASTPPPPSLFSDLITANHILHHQNVLDAYGHISVRNPQNAATFFISRSLAPALVSAREDIEEYFVEDATPVNKNAPKGYAERFIHSELFKKYSEVHSVIHSHNEAVIPFSIASTPLRPVYHMAGVIGPQVPVYDIALHYKSSDSKHSLLVTEEHLGAALASGFNPGSLVSKTTSFVKNFVTSSQPTPAAFPSCPVVLMRGHGFTNVGGSIQEAVNRAIFTCSNARIQTTSMLMQGSFNMGFIGDRFGAGEKETGPAKREEVKFLSDRECKDAWGVIQGTADRPWKLWCFEVENSSLYRNAYLEEAGDGDGDGDDDDGTADEEAEHER